MEEIKKAIKELAPEGKIPCVMAFKVAREHNCGLDELGKLCNELNIKVVSCQLGCF